MTDATRRVAYSPPGQPGFEEFWQKQYETAERRSKWAAGACFFALALALIVAMLYRNANDKLQAVELTHADTELGLLNEIRDLKGAVAGKQLGLDQNEDHINGLRESLAVCDCPEIME